jgi:hypothetical protein
VPQGPLLNLSFAALQNAQGRYLPRGLRAALRARGAVLQYTAPKKRRGCSHRPMLVVSGPRACRS